uniref:Gustatory receptor n=1 Tax=Globodera rostochiensis TaxID=31243 RepID=A0A914I2Z1_GLORO
MASSNATEKTIDFEMFLLFLGGAIDLLANLVGVPLSVINLCLVARTSVIHPNMKFILIFQSFFILTLFLSVYIAVTSSPDSKPPLTSLITTAVQLVVGSVELAMFDGLCQYNSKIYQKMLSNEDAHNLSLRYQLSENIRIGKQLIPPLSLNLLSPIFEEGFVSNLA